MRSKNKKVAKVQEKEEKKFCSHCGGTLREYRGSRSCLMCGRDEAHLCDNCQYIPALAHN